MTLLVIVINLQVDLFRFCLFTVYNHIKLNCRTLEKLSANFWCDLVMLMSSQ